jgi:hypothetical protein
MVEAGNRKLSDITFEDIVDLLSTKKSLRTAVIRHLVQNHANDFLKAINIVPRAAATKSSKGK